MARAGDISKKIIENFFKYRHLHLTWVILLTLISAMSVTGLQISGKQILTGLRVDNSMKVWYGDDDPIWAGYMRFQEQFESDEFVLVAFQSEDIFHPVILRKIADLTDKLAALPYVLDVTSLTNVDHFWNREGTLMISELIPVIPEGPKELRRIKDLALHNPLYTGNVISADGRAAGILVRMEKPPDRLNYQREFTDLLEALLEKESEDGAYEFHAAGATNLIGLQDRATTDDALVETGLSFFLLALVLYFLHRRVVFVIMSLLVVMISNLWIHGLMAFVGSTFNMLTGTLVSLIMVIGVADSIHFVSEYTAQAKNQKSALDASRRAFLLVVIPCLFTSLTTAAGFLSMTVSEMRALQIFSLYAAGGMFTTFLVNMVFISICLSYLRQPYVAARQRNAGRFLRRLMEWVAGINRKHVRINIIVAVGVFLVSFTGIVKMEVNSYGLEYFRESHPVRKATEFIETKLAGTIPYEIMLQGPPGSFSEPEVLKRIDILQQYIASRPKTSKTFSIVDYLKEINEAIQDGGPSFRRIPDTRQEVAQLMLLAEGNETLESYVEVIDYSVARIHSRVENMKNNGFKKLNAAVLQKGAQLFDPVGIKVETAGLVPLGINLCDYVVDTQLKGFSLALVAIFLMLSLLVRSFKLGIIGMIPNIIPVALTFGIMGWTGIYLDTTTVLIASVAIGLAVDDTIHFISRFRLLFDKYGNYEAALDETIRVIGIPLTITSAALFFGFGTMLMSTFVPLANFGFLGAITVMAALVGDLFVLPALIKVFKPVGPERNRSV